MNAIVHTIPEYVEARIQRDLEKGLLRAVEGTLQRINYQRREFTVIANCHVWTFVLDRDAQTWFDDRQAVLRCFHPLDQVRVIFAPAEGGGAVKAMYAWEKRYV